MHAIKTPEDICNALLGNEGFCASIRKLYADGCPVDTIASGLRRRITKRGAYAGSVSSLRDLVETIVYDVENLEF